MKIGTTDLSGGDTFHGFGSGINAELFQLGSESASEILARLSVQRAIGADPLAKRKTFIFKTLMPSISRVEATIDRKRFDNGMGINLDRNLDAWNREAGYHSQTADTRTFTWISERDAKEYVFDGLPNGLSRLMIWRKVYRAKLQAFDLAGAEILTPYATCFLEAQRRLDAWQARAAVLIQDLPEIVPSPDLKCVTLSVNLAKSEGSDIGIACAAWEALGGETWAVSPMAFIWRPGDDVRLLSAALHLQTYLRRGDLIVQKLDDTTKTISWKAS